MTTNEIYLDLKRASLSYRAKISFAAIIVLV